MAETAARRVAEAFFDHLVVERGASANTLGAYRRDLAKYLDYLDRLGRADLRDRKSVV